jgi:hypothetical protein
MEAETNTALSREFEYVAKVLALLAVRNGIPLDRGLEAYERIYRSLDSSMIGPQRPVLPVTIREYGPEDLEPQNFRVGSEEWEERTDGKGIRYRINPEGDVTELLEGPYAGEQYFEPVAAERELAKAGKRTMSEVEWESFQRRHAEWTIANLPFAGMRYGSEGPFASQGTDGYYRIVPPAGTSGFYANVSSTREFAVRRNHQVLAFSVRCLKPSAK